MKDPQHEQSHVSEIDETNQLLGYIDYPHHTLGRERYMRPEQISLVFPALEQEFDYEQIAMFLGHDSDEAKLYYACSEIIHECERIYLADDYADPGSPCLPEVKTYPAVLHLFLQVQKLQQEFENEFGENAWEKTVMMWASYQLMHPKIPLWVKVEMIHVLYHHQYHPHVGDDLWLCMVKVETQATIQRSQQRSSYKPTQQLRSYVELADKMYRCLDRSISDIWQENLFQERDNLQNDYQYSKALFKRQNSTYQCPFDGNCTAKKVYCWNIVWSILWYEYKKNSDNTTKSPDLSKHSPSYVSLSEKAVERRTLSVIWIIVEQYTNWTMHKKYHAMGSVLDPAFEKYVGQTKKRLGIST